jgi:hypothetical protein
MRYNLARHLIYFQTQMELFRRKPKPSHINTNECVICQRWQINDCKMFEFF